jgi:hypothetical protein
MANLILTFLNVELFVTKTVNELILGYDDELLRTAATFDSDRFKSSKFFLIGDVS